MVEEVCFIMLPFSSELSTTYILMGGLYMY